jgi:hypothetical protein
VILNENKKLKKSKFPTCIVSYSSVEFQSTQGEIITAWAILSNLDYPEISEALWSNFIVNALINTPSACSSLLLESFLFFNYLKIVVKVIW